jgi:hypothetical protein
MELWNRIIDEVEKWNTETKILFWKSDTSVCIMLHLIVYDADMFSSTALTEYK